MGVTRIINRRTAVLSLLLVILATAGFGFAAGNTVERSGAGDGAAGISGYNVTDIDYVLSTPDPSNIVEIHFTLESKNANVTALPGTVMAKVVEAGNAWYTCISSNTAPLDYVCTGQSSSVADADQLRVVAARRDRSAMPSQARRSQFRTGAILLVIVVLGWLFFAPPLLGGRTSYVIINGNSMYPVYERGDLVLVRKQSSYAVGDIVTYQHPTIGPIIHRIIDQDGDQFILQGDHNDWLDSYQPIPAEVIGEEWVHLPKVGKAITWVRGPGLVILIIALIGAGVVLPRSDQRRVGQRVPRTGQRPHADVRALQPAHRQPTPPPERAGWLDQSARDALGWVGLLAAACLLIGGFAFMRPTERTVSVDGSYSQQGTFSYSAAAPSGIYDTPEVATGDPIFRSVSDTITFAFDYQFSSDLPTAISGSWDLNAVMSAENGWTRTVPLVTDQSFEGSAFTAEATIDLDDLTAITERVSSQTGVLLNNFKLAIVPDVQVNGSVAGQPVTDVFVPEMMFRVDPMELRLASSDQDDALAPTSTGVVQLPKVETNTIPVMQWSFGVPLARIVAVAGLILSAVAAIAIVLLARWRNGGGATTSVASRYKAMMVDISDPDPAMNSQGQIVAVRSFDDLARLAERDDQVILRHAANGLERFIVRCADITYQYSATPGATR